MPIQIFSGLMSLCKKCFECKNSSLCMIWSCNWQTVFKENLPILNNYIDFIKTNILDFDPKVPKLDNCTYVLFQIESVLKILASKELGDTYTILIQNSIMDFKRQFFQV